LVIEILKQMLCGRKSDLPLVEGAGKRLVHSNMPSEESAMDARGKTMDEALDEARSDGDPVCRNVWGECMSIPRSSWCLMKAMTSFRNRQGRCI
jgi:hypothetical protein